MGRREDNGGNLGEQELALLRFVQDNSPVSARETVDKFGTPLGLARTTIATMLERLRKKGYLNRKKIGAVFIYSPAQEKSDVMRSVVRDFVDRALGGSLSPFVAYLAKEKNLTKEEVEQLRGLLREDEQRGS